MKCKKRVWNTEVCKQKYQNHKAERNLSIGILMKAKLRKFLEDGDIDYQLLDKFYDGVKHFFSTAFCTAQIVAT